MEQAQQAVQDAQAIHHAIVDQVNQLNQTQAGRNLDVTYVDPSHIVPGEFDFPEAATSFLTKRKIEEKAPRWSGNGSWTLFKEDFGRFAIEQRLNKTPWLMKVILFRSLTGKARLQARYHSPHEDPHAEQTWEEYLREIQDLYWSQATRDQADYVFRSYVQESDQQPPGYYATKKFSLFQEAGYSMTERDWNEYLRETARGLICTKLASELLDQQPKPRKVTEVKNFLTVRAAALVKKAQMPAMVKRGFAPSTMAGINPPVRSFLKYDSEYDKAENNKIVVTGQVGAMRPATGRMNQMDPEDGEETTFGTVETDENGVEYEYVPYGEEDDEAEGEIMQMGTKQPSAKEPCWNCGSKYHWRTECPNPPKVSGIQPQVRFRPRGKWVPRNRPFGRGRPAGQPAAKPKAKAGGNFPPFARRVVRRTFRRPAGRGKKPAVKGGKKPAAAGKVGNMEPITEEDEGQEADTGESYDQEDGEWVEETEEFFYEDGQVDDAEDQNLTESGTQ